MPKIRPLSPNAGERAWMDVRDPGLAEAAWRYAAMLNTLDAGWITPNMAAQATYQSQSVFETLHGRATINDYLMAKMQTLRDMGGQMPVRAELADIDMPGGVEPCVAVYQRQGHHDQSAFDRPVGCMSFKVVGDRITGLLMLTVAPAPGQAILSGLLPLAMPLSKPRAVLHEAGNCQDVQFHLALLDGRMELDLLARKTLEDILPQYPGSTLEIIEWQSADADSAERVANWGFTGFPALAVTLRNQLVFRTQGIPPLENLVRAIRPFLGT